MRAGTLRQFAVGAAIALAVTGGFASYRIATRPEQHLPSQWMTETDQERLYEALYGLSGGKWAAGCMWEREGQPVGDVLALPDDVTNYESTDGPAMTFAVADTPGPNDYEEAEGRGYFCYVPTR